MSLFDMLLVAKIKLLKVVFERVLALVNFENLRQSPLRESTLVQLAPILESR